MESPETLTFRFENNLVEGAERPAMKRRRVAVLGGGMTGSVLSLHAKRLNAGEITLFERADILGGLHKSPEVDGFPYDIGAFFFSPDHPVFRIFPGLIDHFVEFDLRVRTVTEGGKQDRYPLSISGYRKNHGSLTMLRAGASILWNKWANRTRDTLPAICRYYVGDVIYMGGGLKNYIERLYSLHDHEIDPLFATKRMAKLVDLAGFRNRFATSLRDAWKPRKHAVALARPRAGFQHMYAVIECALTAEGVDVRTEANVQGIEKDERGFLVSTDRKTERFDAVVSTIPVPVTARLIDIPIHQRFETVSLLTLFYSFEGDPGFDAEVMSNFSNSGRWKRMIDFSGPYGRSHELHRISVEIPLAPHSGPVDIQAAHRDFMASAHSLGLLVDGDIELLGHHLTPHAYPIYRTDAVADLERDKQAISDWGILLCGRQGAFDYVSSAAAAANAIAMAERLARDAATALTPSNRWRPSHS
ncbi:FAD-dependent oxidoreductase [Sphingopyxis sp. PAMC25046]|uniref:FAD-dependent oxidoreductase n=1 Tax=Sphingopyxis sp. PAMC25046 TaxID=2565556 RepID=UPI001446BFA8|nr:FAD-dependent oxidoreductase [Sphingopyxis sp. PAMC25046]